MLKLSEFGEMVEATEPIQGYLMLGYRQGRRHFHMYDDGKEDMLFGDDESFTGEVYSNAHPFYVFARLEDAREDAAALKKCCYNEDACLEMRFARCVIEKGTACQSGSFIGYEAYTTDRVTIEEVIR